MKANQFTTARALLKSLSVADIETRLRELIAEEKALQTVLRSLKARERERAKQTARLIAQSDNKLMRGNDPRLAQQSRERRDQSGGRP